MAKDANSVEDLHPIKPLSIFQAEHYLSTLGRVEIHYCAAIGSRPVFTQAFRLCGSRHLEAFGYTSIPHRLTSTLSHFRIGGVPSAMGSAHLCASFG
jgi:hypothetical protein